MAVMSNVLRNRVIDYLRGQAPAALTGLYVGLLTCTNGALARSTAYTVGQTVVQVGTSDSKLHLYSVTTAGTTAASAPAYAGAAGEAITDGTAVLTEQTAGLQAGTAAVEVAAANGYARFSLGAAMTSLSATQGGATASTGTTGATSNLIPVTFPQSTGAWTTGAQVIWGWGLYDAATAGNLLDFGTDNVISSV
ncbi:MAG: hypothetical protein KGH75_05810, partial [Rhodospirillales bacterium]|nr:hypothetical protein [Rhodospirillales bacterium]